MCDFDVIFVFLLCFTAYFCYFLPLFFMYFCDLRPLFQCFPFGGMKHYLSTMSLSAL